MILEAGAEKDRTHPEKLPAAGDPAPDHCKFMHIYVFLPSYILFCFFI